MKITPARLGLLREALAALEHERWSRWQKHLHGRLVTGRTVHGGDFERWEKLIATPYAELAEHSKNSDRREADKTIALLQSFGLLASPEGGQ